MISLNISIVIVGSFLLLTLVVGIYFSRKKTTFEQVQKIIDVAELGNFL